MKPNPIRPFLHRHSWLHHKPLSLCFLCDDLAIRAKSPRPERRFDPTLPATLRCPQPKLTDERCSLSSGDHVSRPQFAKRSSPVGKPTCGGVGNATDRLLWGNHLVAGLGSHWVRGEPSTCLASDTSTSNLPIAPRCPQLRPTGERCSLSSGERVRVRASQPLDSKRFKYFQSPPLRRPSSAIAGASRADVISPPRPPATLTSRRHRPRTPPHNRPLPRRVVCPRRGSLPRLLQGFPRLRRAVPAQRHQRQSPPHLY